MLSEIPVRTSFNVFGNIWWNFVGIYLGMSGMSVGRLYGLSVFRKCQLAKVATSLNGHFDACVVVTIITGYRSSNKVL
jgi:hypothetical protein